MNDLRRAVDLERYLARVVTLRRGSRYDHGVRAFDCVLCGDQRARGWVNVEYWTAGCWNVGCRAEPRLSGGVVEWVRLREQLTTRGQVWQLLLSEYRRAAGTAMPRPAPRAAAGRDWVKLPADFRPLVTTSGTLGARVEAFLLRQWGLTLADAAHWGLGYALSDLYARRVIIPVVMNGIMVGFQARTWHEAVEPKYRTSRLGIDCNRPASAMLFGYDVKRAGREVLVVEGAGDVMGWHRGGQRAREPYALALLGTALSADKLALIAALEPRRVIVALDDEPDAQRRAQHYLDDLTAWGLDCELGTWVGGKDAGSGAALMRVPVAAGVRAQVARRLGVG